MHFLALFLQPNNRISHMNDCFCCENALSIVLQVVNFVTTCEAKFSKARLEIFKCTWAKCLLETKLGSSDITSIVIIFVNVVVFQAFRARLHADSVNTHVIGHCVISVRARGSPPTQVLRCSYAYGYQFTKYEQSRLCVGVRLMKTSTLMLEYIFMGLRL